MSCRNPLFATVALVVAALAGCAAQGPARLSHLGHATRCSIAAGPNGSVYVAYVDGSAPQCDAYVRFAKDGTHFDPPLQLSDAANPHPVREIQLLTDARGTVWALYSTAARAGNGELFARALDAATARPPVRIGKPLGMAVGEDGALDGVWSWAAAKDAAGTIHVAWSEDPRPAEEVRISTCAPRAIRHATLETSGLSKLETLAEAPNPVPAAGWRCLDLAIAANGAPQVLALNLDTQNIELVTPQRSTPVLASASYDLPEGRPSIGRLWIDAPAARPRFFDPSYGGLQILACRQYSAAELANLHGSTDTPDLVAFPLESLLAGKAVPISVHATPGASLLAGGFWLAGDTGHQALLVAMRNPDQLEVFPQAGKWVKPLPFPKCKVTWAAALPGPGKKRPLLTLIESAGQSWVELQSYQNDE